MHNGGDRGGGEVVIVIDPFLEKGSIGTKHDISGK